MCYYCPCFTKDKTDIQKSYINYPSHMEDMTVPGSEINWFWFREQCLNRLSRKQALFMNTYFTGLSLIRYWWVIGSCDELGKQTIKGTGWIWLSQVVVVSISYSTGLTALYPAVFDAMVPIFPEVTLYYIPHDTLSGWGRLCSQMKQEAPSAWCSGSELVVVCGNICNLQYLSTKGSE